MPRKKRAKSDKASKSLLTLSDAAATTHLSSQPESLNDHLNRYFSSLQKSPGASTPMQKRTKRRPTPKNLLHGFDEGTFKYTPAAASGIGDQIVLKDKESSPNDENAILSDSSEPTPQEPPMSSRSGEAADDSHVDLSSPALPRQPWQPTAVLEGVVNSAKGNPRKRPTARKSCKLSETAKQQMGRIKSAKSFPSPVAAENDKMIDEETAQPIPEAGNTLQKAKTQLKRQRAREEKANRVTSNGTLHQVTSTASYEHEPPTNKRARISRDKALDDAQHPPELKQDQASASLERSSQRGSAKQRYDENFNKNSNRQIAGAATAGNTVGQNSAAFQSSNRALVSTQSTSDFDANLQLHPRSSTSGSEGSGEGEFSELEPPVGPVAVETHCQHMTFVRNQLNILREPLLFAGSLQQFYCAYVKGRVVDSNVLPQSAIDRVVKLYNKRHLQHDHRRQDAFERTISLAASALDRCGGRDGYDKLYWKQASRDSNFVPPTSIPEKHGASHEQFTKYEKLVKSISEKREERDEKRKLLQSVVSLSREVRALMKSCSRFEANQSKTVSMTKNFVSKLRNSLTDAEKILRMLKPPTSVP